MLGLNSYFLIGFALALSLVKIWDQISLPINQPAEKKSLFVMRQLVYMSLGFLVIRLASGKILVYDEVDLINFAIYLPFSVVMIFLTKVRFEVAERWREFFGAFMLMIFSSLEFGGKKLIGFYSLEGFLMALFVVFLLVGLMRSVGMRFDVKKFRLMDCMFYNCAFLALGSVAKGFHNGN